ncbi:Cas9 inhibitor AcrIIA9 family protein [Listeria monocytogenes]|uniref:Cas9 inhibitor AcrIIA9 family protein n=1 Tax=Listeria monocytogenes TaxID=1639 RepID=UPI000766C77C|nr:Cas9 inhibitor AcrIIA9 family protein [Listeria monocytogenes]EAC4842326.1 hypothetical protein [Listeria monocytogenes]EAC7343475.1 hypothetical protein [Listeria monocytogenes]EAC9467686.1 hypothetical protein [Listeria monocytogenes]EAD0460518.1 hypothetical protein [Listeria monocytogenes]EAD6997194.1 hypothetical protein [Listeria monocytogenes]
MTTIEAVNFKEKALEKMLDEMNGIHSGAEDVIHNWLCDQEEPAIFEGVLKEGRSIKGAVKYCSSRASKHQHEGVAMIDDETVFSWVRKYFISEKVPKSCTKATVKTTAEKSKPKQKPKAKPKKKEEKSQEGFEQLNLLDFL